MKQYALIPTIKGIGTLAVLVVAIVLILQNTEPIVTRLLFVTIRLPLAILLALTWLVGLIGGIIAILNVGSPSKKQTKEDAAA